MNTSSITATIARLFGELVDGANQPNGAFILNTGDDGVLRSLETLSAADASSSANGGATIAAHAQHVRYGLSLMNRWAQEGGNPFADATWDAAWKISAVDTGQWDEIRRGLHDEAHRWLDALKFAVVDVVRVEHRVGRDDANRAVRDESAASVVETKPIRRPVKTIARTRNPLIIRNGELVVEIGNIVDRVERTEFEARRIE